MRQGAQAPCFLPMMIPLEIANTIILVLCMCLFMVTWQ